MSLTFTQKIKEQICSIQYSDNELKSFLSAFFKNNIAIHLSSNQIYWEVKSKTPIIVEFVCNTFNKLYKDSDKKVTISKKNSSSNGVYKLDFEGDFSFVEKDLCIFTSPKPLLKNHLQKNAYIAGAFLSGGSVNNPNSSNYHFEIRTYNQDLANDIIKILKDLKIKVFTTKRKELNVVYVKKSEMIADLLKYLNTTEALFEFEDKRILRDYTNQVQRLNNLDMSNLKKSVESGNEQIEIIKKIKRDGKTYNELTEKEKIYCEIRLNNPAASLSEIMNIFIKKYNIQISRTGINHYVRKIKKLEKFLN